LSAEGELPFEERLSSMEMVTDNKDRGGAYEILFTPYFGTNEISINNLKG
jgi:hypothetical protein